MYKSCVFHVKGFDFGKRQVEIAGSAFGIVDTDMDIIDKGAYLETIAEHGPAGQNRIKILNQHDRWDPIGAPLKLWETDSHLMANALISDTRSGIDVLKLYRDNVLTEHSVRITDIVRRSGDPEENMHISKVRLWEISPVTWGANRHTPRLSMKSLDEAVPEIKGIVSRIEKVQANIPGDVSDDFFLKLTEDLSDWKGLLASLTLLGEAEKEIPEEGKMDKMIEEASTYIKSISTKLVFDAMARKLAN